MNNNASILFYNNTAGFKVSKEIRVLMNVTVKKAVPLKGRQTLKLEKNK